ncbi:MAG: helix-turn-helix transcriptional regulator [Verrucomicrobiae bacterium]|nr:helix-turn-helix transcriptional regulator [Verrucomicrobiae bacterium]
MLTRAALLDAIEYRHRRALALCLCERRHLARLTQKELANLACVSPSEIQHIERIRRNPGSGTLKRVTWALGIFQTELIAQVERVESRWAIEGL